MHLPHLAAFSKQPLLFITTCAAGRRPLFASESAHEILKAIWTKSPALDGWHVGHYLLMPDHVHFFAVPNLEAKELPVWMKTWKSISARRLIAIAELNPPVWQSDYFDHFVRSPAAYREKWHYVRENPVRQGLCAQGNDWPFQGTLSELDGRFAG